jgi:hypothetical protein
MSTTALGTPTQAQRISFHPQQLKAPPSTQHTAPDSHITQSSNINNSKQNHKPVLELNHPPANMANPWFGSDVAARRLLAVLRAAVVQAAGHCPGCAAAVLMKHNITATAAAAVL